MGEFGSLIIEGNLPPRGRGGPLPGGRIGLEPGGCASPLPDGA